jgi:UMF1 family MFS transporter
MNMDNPTLRKAWFGWCMYDWANSGFATVVMAAVFPVYFTSLVPPSGAQMSFSGLRWTVPPSALWGYLVSASMFLVALSAPYLGAYADSRGSRHRLLVLFTLTGAAATSLLFFTGHGAWLPAALLFLAANFSFASANVFYNAFLPALARKEEMDRLSARGFAWGYLGGGLTLLFVFVLIQWYGYFGFPGRGEATRAGLLLTGLWWAVFAVPTFLFVREEALPHRPGRLLPGLRGYLRTFAQVRRYPDLLRFLVAFLFYNDGIQTIIVVSAVFAREELGLSQASILGCFLMIQFVAMPGTLFFGRLAEKMGAKRAVLFSLFLFIAVTCFAYFMHSAWQFWVLGAVVAVIFGGSQAISRSLFGSLVPPGENAEFFGFYAISAKFASVLGPLVFAVIANLTGSPRRSIVALAAFFLLGIVLLWGVNVDRGKAVASGETP